ncbi:MAG TPA: hypothetical protein VJY35_10945 [Candidatus Eisenbacteria bacterium]|nr:hypothetical protein [Candidatus Eisenbacteria bacterium]
MPLPAFLIALVLAAAPAFAASPTSPGPTLAIEDTMHTEVPEVLVRAPRVTLDEILDRVARGEARRDSMLKDVVFTATMRVVRDPASDKPKLFAERVSRVYRKGEDKVRTVTLRHWDARPPKKRGEVDMNFTAGNGEEIVNFAFQPKARKNFRYHIVGRDLLGDHLIYRIAFEPRSLLGMPDPGGIVWVDTRDFIIVRQELDFTRSPTPLIIKGIDRAIIERQEVDGYWVLKRLIMRATFTVPIPRFGRAFDIAVQFDDYRINQGIDDAMFTKAVKP